MEVRDTRMLSHHFSEELVHGVDTLHDDACSLLHLVDAFDATAVLADDSSVPEDLFVNAMLRVRQVRLHVLVFDLPRFVVRVEETREVEEDGVGAVGVHGELKNEPSWWMSALSVHFPSTRPPLVRGGRPRQLYSIV